MASHQLTSLFPRAKKPVKVVAATNYKGGVGKSTTARCLGQELSIRDSFTKGKPILIIDLDPQGSFSSIWNMVEISATGQPVPKFNPDISGHSSICDLWQGILGLGDAYAPEPYETDNPLIHFLPAHEAHMLLANRMDDEARNQMADIMLAWIRSESVAERYSAVIIDTQPGKAPMLDIALICSTHCYVPFIPEQQSIEGMYSIITYIKNMQTHRPDGSQLVLLGCLANMYLPRVVVHRVNLLKLRKDPDFKEYIMPIEMQRRIPYAATDDVTFKPSSVTQIGGAIKREVERFADYVVASITAGEK